MILCLIWEVKNVHKCKINEITRIFCPMKNWLETLKGVENPERKMITSKCIKNKEKLILYAFEDVCKNAFFLLMQMLELDFNFELIFYN